MVGSLTEDLRPGKIYPLYCVYKFIMQHSKSNFMSTSLIKLILRLAPGCIFLLSSQLHIMAQNTIIITDPPYNAVCDGINDDVLAVQAAINAINNGDTLIIPGPTGIGAPGLEFDGKNNITIRGNGNNAGFWALTGLFPEINNLTLGHTMFRVINSDSVVVKDLIFDGNNYDFIPVCFGNTNYSEILSCEVRNTNAIGPWPQSSALAGISSVNSRYFKVISNHIHDLSGDTPTEGPRGIWLGGVQPYLNDDFDIVRSNIVENTSMTGITVHGVSFIVDSNYVYNSGGAGIKIETSVDSTTGFIHINNNTLVKHFFHGVQLGISWPGVTLRNLLIENNYIDSTQNSGIRVFAVVENLTIKDNIIRNVSLLNCINGYNYGEGGIYISAGLRNASITDNIISAGNVDGNCGQGIGFDNYDPPFNFANIENVAIRNNIISKIKYHGVRIRTSSASQPIDSIFVECNIFDTIGQAALQIENGGTNVGMVSWCWNTIGAMPDTFNLTGYSTNDLYTSCLPCDSLTNLTEHLNSELNIKVYPNPVNDKLFISNLNMAFEYAIIDIYGRHVRKGKLFDYIPVEELPAGVYLLIINNKTESSKIKFIKN